MGKLWDELEEIGLEDAIKRAVTTTPIGAMLMYINKAGTWMTPIYIMTDGEIMKELREMAFDGGYYRNYNLQQYQATLDKSSDEVEREAIKATMQALRNISDLECVVNLPKFIRLCFEMIERGYDLEDIFFDKPN